jgi:hypothetical protein
LSTAQEWARATVLGDQPALYLRCTGCGLVFVPEAPWLDRAYSDAISGLDTGLLDRCLVLSNITAALLRSEGMAGGRFLDWAGGYGALTRFMRDRGFDFQDFDPLAQNVFAGAHRLAELRPEDHFDAVTAFEVLEHLADPVGTLRAVAESSDMLVLTTRLLPAQTPRPTEWDYYALGSGQHITFYTPGALRTLGRRLGYDHITPGGLVHLFQRRPPRRLSRMLLAAPRAAYVAGLFASVPDRRRSLTVRDSEQHLESLGP